MCPPSCWHTCGFSCISQPIYPTQKPLFPNRSCLDCWVGGGWVLVEQVLICEGNKLQIQSNHIITHWKNLSFLLKAGPGSKCKFTVFRHILWILEHKIRCFVVISMALRGKVHASVSAYLHSTRSRSRLQYLRKWRNASLLNEKCIVPLT